MNVSLTPQLEEWIEKKVQTGLYQTASEVVREALRLLEERDRIHEMRLEQLRKETAIGLKDIEEGRVTEFDDALFERIKSEGRKKLEQRRKRSA